MLGLVGWKSISVKSSLATMVDQDCRLLSDRYKPVRVPMKIKSGIVGWYLILYISRFEPNPPQPRFIGLKLLKLQVSPPSRERYIPCV